MRAKAYRVSVTPVSGNGAPKGVGGAITNFGLGQSSDFELAGMPLPPVMLLVTGRGALAEKALGLIGQNVLAVK